MDKENIWVLSNQQNYYSKGFYESVGFAFVKKELDESMIWHLDV